MTYNIAKQDIAPSAEITGNLPMFSGILKGRFFFGCLYLSIMALRFTIPNVEKRKRFVMYATVSMFLMNTKTRVMIPITNIASVGVLCFLFILVRNLGNTFFSAIPNNILEVVTRVIKTVFDVEKSAIIARIKKATSPKENAATSANGADELANFCQLRILTALMATRT
tara:strand:+ start:509 stop:1015 length:507 start_codon:yes stop_codon:yes gene_type:complete